MIYSAGGGGLRPLWDALEKFQDRSGLILHDKVMGFAAARLIVYSGRIAAVFAKVASAPARQFLEKNGILLTASEVVENILTRDQSAVCPGEVIALNTDAPDVFLQKIGAMLNLAGLAVETIR